MFEKDNFKEAPINKYNFRDRKPNNIDLREKSEPVKN